MKKIVILLIALCLSPVQAFGFDHNRGENYFGISVGVASPLDITDLEANGELTGTPVTIEVDDLSLDTEFAFGAKIGHYFSHTPWFGVEASYYARSPEAEPQNSRDIVKVGNGPSQTSSVAEGKDALEFDYVRTIGLSAMARYQDDRRWEPYGGVGLAINFVKYDSIRAFDTAGTLLGVTASTGEDDFDVALGPLVTLGVNYKFTRAMKAYSEMRWTWSQHTIDDFEPFSDLEFTYSDFVFQFGLSGNF